MQVKTFDEKKLNKKLKECDPYILLYIKALKNNMARWQDVAQTAINKIRELSKIKKEDV